VGVTATSVATGAGLHPARYNTANWVAVCSSLTTGGCSLLVDGLQTACANPMTSSFGLGAVTINTGYKYDEATTGWQVRAPAECL
jgi:hypothetical protein